MRLARQSAVHTIGSRASLNPSICHHVTYPRIRRAPSLARCSSRLHSARPALPSLAAVARSHIIPHATEAATSRSHLLRYAFLSSITGLGTLASWANPSNAASVGVRRSLEFSQPATLTIRNDGSRLVKIYWLNYDGDQELFAYIEPFTSWTVDTYSSHPWRVADAETGVVLKEVVAAAGAQTVEVTGKEKPVPPPVEGFNGFDGIGGKQSDYGAATLGTLYVAYDVGAVTLNMEDFKYPVEIPLPSPQLVGLVEAAAGEMRRPSLLQSWQRTLLAAGVEVERVVVTRVVPPYFYTRIVLRLPDGSSMSVDAQPGDSIALAQQTGCPLYVANDIARLVNRLMEDAIASDALGSLVPGAPPRQPPLLPKSPAVPGLPEDGGPPITPAPGAGRARKAYPTPFASLDDGRGVQQVLQL